MYNHLYSLVLIGFHKNYSKNFFSRESAMETMYDLMTKYHLKLKKIYDDKHDKTYICTNGAEFHINRW